MGLIGVGSVLARMGVFLQLAMVDGSAPRRAFRGNHEFLITGVVFLLVGVAVCVASGWAYLSSARRSTRADTSPSIAS